MTERALMDEKADPSQKEDDAFVGRDVWYYPAVTKSGVVAPDPGPESNEGHLHAVISDLVSNTPKTATTDARTVVHLGVLDPHGGWYARQNVHLLAPGQTPDLGEAFCEWRQHSGQRVKLQEQERQKVAAEEARAAKAAAKDTHNTGQVKLGEGAPVW